VNKFACEKVMRPLKDTKPQQSKERVLVVVPCLNEERHIEEVLTRLVDEAAHVNLKIVIADGGSTDRTRTIVQELNTGRRIVLMDNPKRIQAVGINEAVRQYGKRSRFLIRIDAHARYPDNFCETLLDVQARTLADSVVVSMRTEGTTCLEQAAAVAQNSILGNGGAAHRNQAGDRWVEHGHHALIKMDAFKAIGGYDETFSHNEDAEFDNRLIGAGFNIFLTASVQVTYFPRSSLSGLFRQYFNIGKGRARNFLRHPRRAKVRHFVLAVVAPALGLIVLAPLTSVFAVPALCWASICIGYGIVLGARMRNRCAMASGIAAMAMQTGWSIGFFVGLLREFPRRRRAFDRGDPDLAKTDGMIESGSSARRPCTKVTS
jgi:succinoglycan biosynthesis protein ExoA